MGKKDNKYEGHADSILDREMTDEDVREFVEKASKGVGRFFLVFFIFIVALIILRMSMVVTYPNEYSVIKQFGKIESVQSSPGLSFKVPLIQSVTTIDNQMMFYDIASSDVITSDKKTMVVDAYVLWRVTDPIKYTQALGGNNNNAESRINAVVFNALKTTISNMTQDEVILSRDGKVDVSNFESEIVTDDIVFEDEDGSKFVQIKSLTEEIADNLQDCSGYGIMIELTEVKVLDLPNDNKNAVFKRMISERENVAAGYEAQGDSEAKIIENTTDKEIAVMEAQATADAEKIIAEGEQEYMRILSSAYNDEGKAEFYSFVRSLDAAKESLKDGTLILDADSPIAKIFYTN